MKRRSLRYALVALATALPAACDDADTIVAVYSPALPEPVEASADAPSEAQVPDIGSDGGEPDADAEPGEPLPTAFYLEAESGALSGPFAVMTSDQASGGEFIVATEAAASSTEPGTARAVYDFTLEEGGDFVIWGRIHSPDALSNQYWVRVDDGSWFKWRISTGEAWFWDDFHDNTQYSVPLNFALSAGAHRLELANAVTGAELDRLYVTARNDHPPGNTTPCNPPHSIEVAGACIRSCGSYGNVSCLSDVCMGQPELEAYDCPICCLEP